MPTGYTADVQSGKVTEFSDFALQCARAMGACISQRDEGYGPPELEEQSNYYEDRVKEATREKDKLDAMSMSEAIEEFTKESEAQIKRCREGIEEKQKQKERYESMIAKVEAWTPPSSEHVGLKEFMLSQLRDSIGFDCSGRYYEDALRDLQSKTPEDWLEQQKEAVNRNLEYYTNSLKKESERVEGRNLWKTQLFESLGKKI